jgi:hypothetical protein
MMKPCKGGILYFALAGLKVVMLTIYLGRCPTLFNYHPCGAFTRFLNSF